MRTERSTLLRLRHTLARDVIALLSEHGCATVDDARLVLKILGWEFYPLSEKAHKSFIDVYREDVGISLTLDGGRIAAFDLGLHGIARPLEVFDYEARDHG